MSLETFLSSDAVIVTIGAVFGGVGAKFLDKTLSKKSDHYTEAERLRTELRAEIESLRTQIGALESEVTQWRELYWKFYEEAAHLKAELYRLKVQSGQDDVTTT